MPVIGIAEVLVQPVFTGIQRKISKEFGPSAEKAGRSAGSQMGKGLASGFAAETAGLEAEVSRIGRAVSQAEGVVTSSKEKMAAASAAESKALGELRVAELKLQEVRNNSNAKASQLAAAEEKLDVIRQRATVASGRRESAERSLAAATSGLGDAHQKSSKASAELETHLKRVADESDNTGRKVSRLSVLLNSAFKGSPLSSMATNMRRDSDRVRFDLSKMASDVSKDGSRGGRAFTQAFVGVVGGLFAIGPAAGAAGAAVLSASGNVITLAASLSSLAGVAALAPAGLMAIGAVAGVLVAAFAGVGDALKTAVDAAGSVSTVNPRLAAMAVEDATMAITVAEENAADAQIDGARRVSDAKRNLQDVVVSVAEAQKAAAKSVMMAERDEARSARDVIAAQRELVKAREDAAKRVLDVGRALAEADRKAADTAKAYKRAVQIYNTAKSVPTSSAELDRLGGNVAQALEADKLAKSSIVALRDERKSAVAEATRGSDKMLAAEQRVTDARQAQADAIQNRKDAQADMVKQERDGARQIADAQQAIADAVRQSEKSQLAASRSVEQAHRSLERVQMQQADAAAQAGQKSSQAMGKLTPAAQEAVKALLRVKDMLGGIRRIAQENFFKGFAAPLLTLAGSVMPQLATGVGAIASALGSGAQIFMGAVQSALGGGVLESLLMGVAKSTQILNTGISPVVLAFTTLGVVGMKYMPRLAQFISDIATRFNGFIQATAADGRLVGWIDAGIQSFKDLWSVAGSVVGIFGSLNRAAEAGGAVSTLAGLAAGMRDIDAAMKGPVFQTTMSTLFSGAEAGSRGLLAALGPIGDAFVRGAPAMAEFLRLGGEIAGTFVGGVFTALSNPQFGAGLVTFMEGLQRGAEAVAPLLPGLTGAVGSLLASLGPIAEKLGPSLVQVFTGFADGLAQVISFLDPLLSAIAGSPVLIGLLIGALVATTAASAALTAAGNIQRIAMTSWAVGAGLVTAAQWLWNASIQAFPGMWIITAIGLVVAGLVWFFTQTELGQQIVQNVWGAIQVAVKAVVDWFQNTAMPVIRQVVAVVGAVFTWLYESVIKPVFAGIGAVVGWYWNNVLKPIFDAMVWVFRNVLGPAFNWLYQNVIKPAFDGIGAAVKWVWDNVLKPVFDFLANAIQKDLPKAFDLGVAAVKKIWQTIQDIAKAPVRFVVDTVINDGLIGAFNNVGGLLGLPKIDPVHLPAGFMTGGYTGDGARDEPAGIVHGGEFVFTKEQTRRAGVSNLYAMAKSLAGYATGGFVNPLKSLSITQGYNRIHKGVDFAAGVGTPVFATEDGRVSWSGPGVRAPGVWGGNEIHVDGSSGIQEWFAHLSSMAVRVGDMVRAGQQIGLSGNTGITSGPHLHFGTFAGGWPNDINPLAYLSGAGVPSGGGFNPLAGIIDGLLSQFKDAFPAGGFIADLAIGVGKKLFGGVTELITGGHGSAAGPALYDLGGILPPGVSQVVNRTGKPEAILNPQQWADIHRLATTRNESVQGAAAGLDGATLVLQAGSEQILATVVHKGVHAATRGRKGIL